MEPLNVLFVNHKEKRCGVFQYGHRVANILKCDPRFNLKYLETANGEGFEPEASTDAIIFNWHPATMPFLTESIAGSLPFKNLFIHHEGQFPSHLNPSGYLMSDMSSAPEEKRFPITRPLFNFNEPVVENDIFTVGSFGFGFLNKGFNRIITEVAEQVAQAKIRLHISAAFFGDSTGIHAMAIADSCLELAKQYSNIDLEITTDFITDYELLMFLNQNDLNLFLYDDMYGRGLASTIDYAASVNRPFAVNSTAMFRHVLAIAPELSLDNSTIDEVLKTDSHLKFKELWSNKKLCDSIYEVICQL